MIVPYDENNDSLLTAFLTRPLPLFYAMAKEEYKSHLLKSGVSNINIEICVSIE